MELQMVGPKRYAQATTANLSRQTVMPMVSLNNMPYKHITETSVRLSQLSTVTNALWEEKHFGPQTPLRMAMTLVLRLFELFPRPLVLRAQHASR